jgi:hypothetical protein
MSLHLVRWWVGLVGGVLLGAGLVLHGQIACARYAKQEVEHVFVLWRAIGELTFFYQDDATQAALWLEDIPDGVLRQSDRAAWTMAVFGAAVAISSLFLTRARKQKRAPARKAKP